MSSRPLIFGRPTATHDKRLDPTRVITEPSARRDKKLPPPPPTLAREKTISFAIKWACGVVSVAASIVFGIWAPLSYKASTSGNASNNEVQSSMVSVMSNNGEVASKANNMASTANELASTANKMATIANDMALTPKGMASEVLSTAIAQGTALAAMQTRLDLMGQLAMVDFCITQSTLEACSHLYQSADVLIESLAGGLLGYPTVNTTPRGSSFTLPTRSAIPYPSASAIVPVDSVSLPGGSVILSPFVSGEIPLAFMTLPGETGIQFQSVPLLRSITDPGSLAVNTVVIVSVSVTSATISPVSRTASASATTSLSIPSTVSGPPMMPPKTTSEEPSEPPATTSEPAKTTSAPGSHVTIPVEAILGTVFGSTGIVGALLGFMIWRLRRHRLIMHEG